MMATKLLLYCLPLFVFCFGVIRYETKLSLLKMKDNEIPVENVNFKRVDILTDPRFRA